MGMTGTRTAHRRTAARPQSAPPAAGSVSPQRKWLAITVATLAFVPAYWALLAGMVSAASSGSSGSAARGPDPVASIAFGLALVPFVFVVLSFASGNPRAPGAVVKAMLLAAAVGIGVSALAGDAVTGVVAGMGAGGAVALRFEPDHSRMARVLAVSAATAYAFLLMRVAGSAMLVAAPVLPFTSIGVADHIAERRRQRDRERAEDAEGEVRWPRS
jgi:hypothetical protein